MTRTITNDLALPEVLVKAVQNDTYSNGGSDISVTGLLQPPQKVAIEKAHADEIVEDAADRIYALIGQIGHLIIERAAVEGSRAEERVFTEVNGWKVSGQFDLLYTNERGERTLADLKLVSVWEAINGPKEERAQQLNLLAELLRRNGETVDRLEVIYVFRDWSKSKARFDSSYPQKQVLLYFIPQWGEEKAAAYLEERVALHQRAQQGEVIPCSDEDRWAKPPTWAVMKEGRKSAVKLEPSYEAAVTYCLKNGLAEDSGDDEAAVFKKGISIVERPGEQTRCLLYCSAYQWCEQGQALTAAPSEEVADAA